MTSPTRLPRTWPAIALLLGAVGVILAGAGSSLSARSDDTTVTSRVDAARIGEGETVTLTVEVRGSNPGNV